MGEGRATAGRAIWAGGGGRDDAPAGARCGGRRRKMKEERRGKVATFFMRGSDLDGSRPSAQRLGFAFRFVSFLVPV